MVEIKAVLGNIENPEKKSVTLWFPIKADQYEAALYELNEQGMGDAVRRDCLVLETGGDCPALKQLDGQTVNLDELNYLARRIDNFFGNELNKFEAMAYKMGLTDIKDLINLTFCCEQATVITNFSELEQVGRNHRMALHSGAMSVKEYQALDGWKEALRLIRNGEGTITPYGVVYDNGMVLEQIYNGRQFPCDICEDVLLTLEIEPKQGLKEGDQPESVNLPASEKQIERAKIRVGIGADRDEMQTSITESILSQQILELLEQESENLASMNTLCHSLIKFSSRDMLKLDAVIDMAKPQDADEVRRLAENLDQFDFVPKVTTPEEYGRYLIKESGKFRYDYALEQFYDYELCGKKQIKAENGRFNGFGYVAYYGTLPLDELMREEPTEAYQQEQSF